MKQKEKPFLLAVAKIGQICGPDLGPFGKCGSLSDATPQNNIASVVSLVLGLITLVAGIYFMFQLIIGGYNFMSSAGDKQKLQTAQDRISYAMIGLVVIVAAYGIVFFIKEALGIDILLQVSTTLSNLQLK